MSNNELESEMLAGEPKKDDVGGQRNEIIMASFGPEMPWQRQQSPWV